MSILVHLQRDTASARVAAVHGLLATSDGRRGLMKVVGVEAEQQLRAWFFKRDAESPNKMGWPRQHFWARIGKRTAFDPAKTTENTATVVVSDPALAAKVNGATIKPIAPHKALAIPMTAAAYGVLPRSGLIPGLFVWRRPGDLADDGAAFLVAREGTGLVFYYRLVPEVTVPKDPQALPPKEQLGAALSLVADDFFRRQGGNT